MNPFSDLKKELLEALGKQDFNIHDNPLTREYRDGQFVLACQEYFSGRGGTAPFDNIRNLCMADHDSRGGPDAYQKRQNELFPIISDLLKKHGVIYRAEIMSAAIENAAQEITRKAGNLAADKTLPLQAAIGTYFNGSSQDQRTAVATIAGLIIPEGTDERKKRETTVGINLTLQDMKHRMSC